MFFCVCVFSIKETKHYIFNQIINPPCSYLHLIINNHSSLILFSVKHRSLFLISTNIGYTSQGEHHICFTVANDTSWHCFYFFTHQCLKLCSRKYTPYLDPSFFKPSQGEICFGLELFFLLKGIEY